MTLVDRARRAIAFGRQQGLSRLLEEKQIGPRARIVEPLEKWRWRRANGHDPGTARAVWLVGLQRSGTNMVLRALASAPEVEIRNENDRRVFRRYRVRSDAVLAEVLARSRHPVVVFKPLCDAHRVVDWLEELGRPGEGRAVWVVRSWEARARSAVAKFGGHSLDVLAHIKAGTAGEHWQAMALSEDSLAVIDSFDYDRLSPASASALLWYVRNRLLFEMGIDGRSDAMVIRYEDVVARPGPEMARMAAFLGIASVRAPTGIGSRAAPGPPLPVIDVRVRALCEDLQRRVDEAVDRGRSRSS